MRITRKPKWKIIYLAVLCLIGILALIGGSLSVYTRNQAYQRGVARNGSSAVVQFTSNYMQACASTSKENEYVSRTVIFSEEEKKKETLPITIYVYNYVNGSNGSSSQKDITYTMNISITGNEKNEAYTVSCDEGESTSIGENGYTKENTLIGRNRSSHRYTVMIPGTAVDRVKITAKATPKNLSATNNQLLAAVIIPCTASETAGFTYDGYFTDTTGSPKDYAGFNYLVSISSGVANAILTWNTDALEIDQYFLKKIGKTKTDVVSTSDVRSTLAFQMSQPNGTDEYLIPFYIKDKEKIPGASSTEASTDNETLWKVMKEYITFTAEQSPDSTTVTP